MASLSATNFWYLNQSGTTKSDAIDDTKDFKDMCAPQALAAARVQTGSRVCMPHLSRPGLRLRPCVSRYKSMTSCGLSDEERKNTMQVISALLHIGQIGFEIAAQVNGADGCSITKASQTDLAKVCSRSSE